MAEEQYDKKDIAKEYATKSDGNKDNDTGRRFLREQVARMDKTSRLLDLGCGSGLDLKTYKDLGITNTYGVDPSEKILEEARALLGKEVGLSVGTFESIPFQDETFDILTSRHALHYSKNLPLAIRESARVIKPGGKFIVVMSHPFADALEARDVEGNIHITLFNGAISIAFPQHRLSEYFSEEFLGLFELETVYEYTGAERDRKTDSLPNALCFVATKK